MQSIAQRLRDDAESVRGVLVAQNMRVAALRLIRLEQALQKIVDGNEDCGCEHDENCCAKTRGFYCPYCIAAVALK